VARRFGDAATHAQHGSHHVVPGLGVGREFATGAPVAHHHDPIGDGEHLGQPV
jgi:hypothetical protein